MESDKTIAAIWFEDEKQYAGEGTDGVGQGSCEIGRQSPAGYDG